MTRGGEDVAAVYDRRRLEAEPHPLDQRGEMPGIDQLAVDRRLAANRVEQGAIPPGRGERMMGDCRIEPRDRAGGAFESSGGEVPIAGDLDGIVHYRSSRKLRSRHVIGTIGTRFVVAKRRNQAPLLARLP